MRIHWLVLISVILPTAYSASVHTTAAGCESCHAGIHKVWAQSRHSKMVQPATRTSVQGDFTRGRIILRGQAFTLAERNGVFYVTDSYLHGTLEEHRVDYTLGNRRIQHYLTKLPDGRIIVLPPSWDILRKQWFHNLDIDDPDEAPGVQVQLWNKNCYSCHVSQEEKNFDPQTERYSTTWLDFGTNCERCHGAGKAHAARYKTTARPLPLKDDIVLQTRLDPTRNTQVCAQCHSLRDTYVTGYQAGANYYDFFLPILEFDYPPNGDPAYFADGRTRRFSNDSIGFWQSECFLQGGATCLSCHREPHNTNIDKNPQLAADRNQLCTGCHTNLSADKEQAVAQHTHHAVGSAGRSCVECHMPRTVTSIKAQIRDHSMSIPVPENTIQHGIPNACNVCHQDRDAQWALKQMTAWYGEGSREKLIRRADAFTLARKSDPASIPLLLAILGNAKEGPFARANAAGHLGRFSYDPTVATALERAIEDPEPLVRAIATLKLRAGPADRDSAIAPLTRALGDSAAIVRIGAAVALVALGVRDLPGQPGEQFKQAKAAFTRRAEHYSDDANQQIAAGRFYLLSGDPAQAVNALELSLRLDPQAAVQYLLGYAYAQRGEISRAKEILTAIPVTDPQYSAAQKLLGGLEAPR